MSNPKIGMNYEDVRKRVKRIAKNAPSSGRKSHLIDSLINQAGRKEGKGAVDELHKELRADSRR